MTLASEHFEVILARAVMATRMVVAGVQRGVESCTLNITVVVTLTESNGRNKQGNGVTFMVSACTGSLNIRDGFGSNEEEFVLDQNGLFDGPKIVIFIDIPERRAHVPGSDDDVYVWSAQSTTQQYC